MEVPNDLKSLYKHWDKHSRHKTSLAEVRISLLPNIEHFVAERMRIWEKKLLGATAPFTKDAVLQNFRFCNIYRELDKQTIEIHRDLQQFESDFSLWLLNLCFQRFICRPSTVKKVGHLSFDKKNNKTVFEKLIDMPRPKYGSAYVFPISVIQKSEFPTRETFFCFYLPKVVKQIAKIIKEFDNLSVNEALEKILSEFEFNFRFHWTEILIDVAYQFPKYIDLFKDFYIGPGAMPTIKLLSENKDFNSTLNNLPGIELETFPYLTYDGRVIPLSAENWEGICCEFRKYTNLKKGTGRRRLYK